MKKFTGRCTQYRSMLDRVRQTGVRRKDNKKQNKLEIKRVSDRISSRNQASTLNRSKVPKE